MYFKNKRRIIMGCVSIIFCLVSPVQLATPDNPLRAKTPAERRVEREAQAAVWQPVTMEQIINNQRVLAGHVAKKMRRSASQQVLAPAAATPSKSKSLNDILCSVDKSHIVVGVLTGAMAHNSGSLGAGSAYE